MWHEARRQERKMRGMLVDYRRRAERRRDFYEKIKADPTQFLQLHGRQCKIHLDPAIAAAADSAAAMMPWQNQPDNLIDRFDVRAHLDFIPPVSKENEEELLYEERQLNYERYRIIAQNSFLNMNEEKFLKQLHLEEQFGYTESEPKKKKSTGAAIGFNYEDGTAGPAQPETNDNASDANSDSDLDVDLSINISKIDQLQAHEMNRHGRNFGMSSNDFYSFLTNDLEEAENYRQAREEEHEKALFSGRKSRRERRAHREKRLANRVISPPSYAARSSPTYPSFRESKSASRSPSPEVAEKITYITSFGDEEEPTTSKPTYADKVKHGRPKTYPKTSSSERTVYRSTRRSRDRDKSYRKRRRSSSSRSPKFKTRGSRSRETSRRSRSISTDRYRKTHTRVRRPVRSRKSSSDSSSSSKSKSKSRSSSSGSGSSSSVVSKGKRSASPASGEKGARKESPPKAIPRYYGRKRSDQSSSDSGEISDQEKNGNQPESNHPAVGDRQTSSGNSGSSIKKTSGPSLSLQERLKRKRQALLNKQFKADKIAEQLKSEREKQEQQHREDELRELALKLRRRQREIRHAYDTNSSSSSESDEKETSPVPTVENKPRSRSASPRSSRGHHSERRESRRERSKERRERDSSPAYVIRRSPKRYEVVKRVVYRDEGVDRGYRSSSSSRRRDEQRRDEQRREEQRRDGRDEQRRESRRDDCKSNRALVDY